MMYPEFFEIMKGVRRGRPYPLTVDGIRIEDRAKGENGGE
jgi:hypothetical protein